MLGKRWLSSFSFNLHETGDLPHFEVNISLKAKSRFLSAQKAVKYPIP